MSKRRLLGADFLRVVACFTVMLHHIVQNMGFSNRFPLLGWMNLFGVIGGLGVGMFFVLSGFLLSRPFWQALNRGEPMPSPPVYALRRAARIVPGYWLSLAVSFVLSVVVFGFVPDGWLIARFVAGLLMVSDWHWTSLFPVEVNGPLWSISFEVTAYVLLPLGFAAVFLLAQRVRNYWVTWLAWLAVIALALVAHWLFTRFVHVDPIGSGWGKGLQGGAKTWMPWINPFSMFSIFAIGALAGGLQIKLARLQHMAFDALAIAAALVAIVLIGHVFAVGSVEAYGALQVPYSFPALPLAFGAFLALAPSSRFLGVVTDNPPIAFLAKISFGIYLWHAELMQLLRKFWLTEAGTGPADQGLFALGAVCVIALSIGVATVSYYGLEVPVLRWARRQEESLTQRRAPTKNAKLAKA